MILLRSPSFLYALCRKKNTQLFSRGSNSTTWTREDKVISSCFKSSREPVFLALTLQDVPMRLAGPDTRGKWEPCVNSLAADQVADPPFFADWDHSHAPHPPPLHTHTHTHTHTHRHTPGCYRNTGFNKRALWWKHEKSREESWWGFFWVLATRLIQNLFML